MPLSEALPKHALKERFPDIVISELGGKQLSDMTALKGKTMFSLGLCIWDIIVSRDSSLDPFALRQYVDAADPSLPRRISHLIGRKVIFDAYYGHATIMLDEKKMTVAETLVAHAYPNHMHIADIEFSNPHKPIPVNERHYQYKEFEGLGLLGDYIDNVENIGRECKCEALTLIAASHDLYRMFSRFGFEVSETRGGERGMRIGRSIPMTKKI